jgi:DNA-binding beta-propeller fold protein YncE
LFVADFHGQCIKVFDRHTGAFLRKIGEAGPDDGQFVRPITVRVNNRGQIVTIDVMKCRVQTFERNGKFVFAFGQMGNHPGDLVRPKHMSIDANGFMYIADAAFNNVQVFDDEGKVVDYFGSPGTHPGSMDLPAGVFVQEGDVDLFKAYVHPAFQAERLILVANQFGPNRVSVYAQGHLKQGKTVADILPARAKVGAGLQDPNKPTTMPTAAEAAKEAAERASSPTTAPATGGPSANN